jgi:hypothetical protein
MSQPDLIRVERAIRIIRGDKVILDEDLAELYGVETKNLIKAVQRNIDRFPADFMFQLTSQEFKDLRFQFGTASQWGGRRTPPYAFSEQGVAMLSSVLHSKRAVQVNIEIMRTFVRLRKLLASNAELAECHQGWGHKVGVRSCFAIFSCRTVSSSPKRHKIHPA